MWMAVYKFVAKAVTYILHIELLFLARNFGIESHVQQYIAQLLTDILRIIGNESIAQLKALLNRVRTQGLVCLFSVPWTLLAQFVKNIKKTAE